MNTCKKALAAVGVKVPSILLPDKDADFSKFSVIACDQFSARADYWHEVEALVGSAPSALNLILPEAYLCDNNDERIEKINKTMEEYLSKDVLTDIGETFVFLRRNTTSGVRKGLVLALDLEHYDYSKDAKTMIRATEGTIIERLPPRIKIRENAPLESPHIMVLIDDKADRLMSYLESRVDSFECLYDFDLMQNGGHSTGFRVDSETDLLKIAEILSDLKAQGGDDFLFAMGDGNHSFATAKACWEKIKPTLSAEQRENHPARWALVEVVNLYDKALRFEPIHRLLYNVDPEEFCRELGFDPENPPDAQVLQPKIDAYLAAHPEAELEYIHGEDECRKLAAADSRRLAIIFGEFERDSLFSVVRQNGVFVRKSFSMGEAVDKRYYLECRKIK